MKKIEIKIERELTANLSDITIERIKTRIEKKIAEELDVRLSRAYLRRMEIDKRQEKEKEIKEQRIAERKRKQEEKLRHPVDPSIIKTIQEKIKNPKKKKE